MKFKNKVYSFMYDRYGIDDLFYFLISFSFFLTFIGFLFRVPFFLFLELSFFFILNYRVFSKNIMKRRKENQFYLDVRKRVRFFFQKCKRNWSERKEFIYKKCRKCKTTLRIPIPNNRGFKYLTCPKCKRRWRVFCFRREKVEIIKANGKKIYH